MAGGLTQVQEQDLKWVTAVQTPQIFHCAGRRSLVWIEPLPPHIRFVTTSMHEPWHLEIYLPNVALANSVQFTVEERFSDSNIL